MAFETGERRVTSECFSSSTPSRVEGLSKACVLVVTCRCGGGRQCCVAVLVAYGGRREGREEGVKIYYDDGKLVFRLVWRLLKCYYLWAMKDCTLISVFFL